MLPAKIMLSWCMPVQIAIMLRFLDTKQEDRLASREKLSLQERSWNAVQPDANHRLCGSLALCCSADSFVIWQGMEKHIGPGPTSVGRWWWCWGGRGYLLRWVHGSLARTNEFQVDQRLFGCSIQVAFTHITQSPSPIQAPLKQDH